MQVHFSINKADIEKVRELVNLGINLNYVIYANTPLTLAIIKEHYDIAHVLIEAGADVNIPEKMDWHRQPIHLAAKVGDLDLVSKLVAHGACVDALDASQMTPLHWASLGGHASTVEWLIKHGVPVHKADYLGHTALCRAAEQNYLDVVRMLSQAGAGVNVRNIHGWSPLFHSVTCNDLPMVEELLGMGAEVNYQDKTGQTVLHIIASRLRGDNLLILCRTDTNFYIRDRQVSCPAAQHAVKNLGNELPIAVMLIDCGADVNIKNGQRESPLLFAAREGNADVVKLFVQAGSDLSTELWVLHCDWPDKLAACHETCNWLRQEAEMTARRLQDICKTVVRRCLGRNINMKVLQLPLPEKVKSFLTVTLAW